MRDKVIFILAAIAICLVGTLDLFNIPYPIFYKIPIALRGVIFVIPSAMFTFCLILYLRRKKASSISVTRFGILLLATLIGLFVIGNISSVFYYIGGAGYEYGARVIPAGIYALWGSIPTFLMFAIFFFGLLKFGVPNRREPETFS